MATFFVLAYSKNAKRATEVYEEAVKDNPDVELWEILPTTCGNRYAVVKWGNFQAGNARIAFVNMLKGPVVCCADGQLGRK